MQFLYNFFLTDVLPRQELLKESYRLMEIRKLLRGYGIRNFNLSYSTQIMVNWIWLIMWHMTPAVPAYKPSVIYCISSPDTD